MTPPTPGPQHPADQSATRHRMWWDITWRLLLIIIGIPAVWILRATGVVHLTAWQAAGLTAVVLLTALGQHFLALVLST